MMEIRSHYTWGYVLSIFAQHKRMIVAAHVIAVCAAMFSVPVPLMLPLLVDEVLLGERGKMIAVLDHVVPSSLHGPAAYIVAILLLTIVLWLVSNGVAGMADVEVFDDRQRSDLPHPP